MSFYVTVLKATNFCVVIALSASSSVAEFLELEDQESYYREGEGAYGFGWVLGERKEECAKGPMS